MADDHRERFPALSGLRGAAALIVVCHHAVTVMGRYLPVEGYLAVDFFFVLSGFVIAHSYDRKIRDGMTWNRFLRVRVDRLYPVYLLGVLVALADAVAGRVWHLGEQWPSWSSMGISGLLTLFCIPTPEAISQHGTLFTLNSSFWSLFFEFIANGVFVLGWRWLRGPALYMLIAVCGAALAWGCLLRGNADVGSSWPEFALGFPRVGFSFFLGVALSRWRLRLTAPWPLIFTIPIAVLLMKVPPAMRSLYDLAAIIGVFPLCVVLGANLRMGSSAGLVSEAFGDASYPIYVLHTAVTHAFDLALHKLHARPEAHPFLYAAPLLVVVASFSWAIYQFYEKPILDILRRRRNASWSPATEGKLSAAA